MSRPRRRAVLECGPKIDIRTLRLRPYDEHNGTWRYPSGLAVKVTLRVWTRSGSLELEYGSTHQIIDVQGLPRHFGGVQWYLRCPVTGEQVLTLWMPPGAFMFAGRNAWRGQVAYRSQFEDELGRQKTHCPPAREF